MRGHIRPAGKDVYDIVTFHGLDAKGKRKYKWRRFKGSEKEAQKELTRLLHEMDTGQYVEPVKLTVAAYLDKWLEDYASVNVAAKTFERYCDIIRKGIAPEIGHYKLGKLQPLHIQSYYTEAQKTGRKDGSGGLSKRTVLQYHRILRKALQQAVKWQLIAKNPVDSVEPPKPSYKEMQVISEAQVDQLLTTAQNSRFYMPIMLAVTTGMRRGEILGLRWQDIDMDNGIATVRRSLEQTRQGLAFKEPKTAKSKRVIILPEMAVTALRKHKGKQAEQKLLLGEIYKDQGLICTKAEGGPMNPNNFSSDFSDLLTKAKLPHIRFHDLRHTHATILLREGIHPKVVSERLGHSTIGITMDVYSHVLPSMQEEAARKLNTALQAASQPSRKDSVA